VNPKRWQRLKEVFEEAVEKDDSSRAAFVEKECRDDPDLKKEVEALLARHDNDSFLEKPAFRAFSEILDDETEDLPENKQLGPYTITGKIGRGGMGVVYRAHDSRLDRSVAIKMLPRNYVKDTQQRERLKREARASARLSHPGIATVYALEEYAGDLFIISEYVSGRTLREVLIGPALPLDTVLQTALKIGRALESAHAQGIVHRDLKPENIMMTDNGDIKILDFGLARIRDGSQSEMDLRLTSTGVFMGTPAYASPEQLLGIEVDFHTDIFSFGVLLYELVSGKHPFGSGDSIATIARILEGEVPGLARSDTPVPAPLESLVRRCLQKRPVDRYPDMKTLLEELDLICKTQNTSLERPLSSGSNVPAEHSRFHPLWWWQFHQAVAGFGYYGMLYPQWRVKEWVGGIEGSLLFFPLVIAVGIAANLRLHLWFTSRFYYTELAEHRRKVSRWISGADWLFVAVLAATAIRIHTQHAIIATLQMAVAIGALVAFTLIEPTTTRAALDRDH